MLSNQREESRALYAERNPLVRIIPIADRASKQWLDDPAVVRRRIYPVACEREYWKPPRGHAEASGRTFEL
jgi:hypothetical protein